MALVLVIIFVSAVCNTPGHAQSSGAYAYANANAFYPGASSSAYANSYGYYYPYWYNGFRDCTYNSCTPTCSVPNPRNCPEKSNPCNCPPGTIISDVGGQCVPEAQCQRYINCRGDYNAVPTDCPHPCPSTCAKPNYEYCGTTGCAPPGCECKSGYILSGINGKCILPQQCPGGYPCNRNQTYINCYSECPSQYCPVDSTRVACGPSGPPCHGGCACKNNYLLKNVKDRTCILTSDCPPGKCSGPNQEWNRCVGLCVSDSCKDRNKVRVPGDCPFSPDECYPGCLCKKGYYRNGFTCVPAEQCPP